MFGELVAFLMGRRRCVLTVCNALGPLDVPSQYQEVAKRLICAKTLQKCVQESYEFNAHRGYAFLRFDDDPGQCPGPAPRGPSTQILTQNSPDTSYD